MEFKPGDILSMDGLKHRTVISYDAKSRIYVLGFVNDPNQTEYEWTHTNVHKTYRLYVPSHIPEQQREKWIKEYRKKKP